MLTRLIACIISLLICIAVVGVIIFWNPLSYFDQSPKPPSFPPVDKVTADIELPLYWFEVTGKEKTRPSLSRTEVEQVINANNHHFKRSNATFAFYLADLMVYKSTECDPYKYYCDSKQIAYGVLNHLHRQVPQPIDLHTIVITMPLNGLNGMAYLGDPFVYLDPKGLNNKDLAHEIGHSLGLLHPFQGSGKQLDLPQVCKRPDRESLLGDCPTSLTCGGNDEAITNVMDYLPYYCTNEFYFSPSQVDVMTRKISIFTNPNKYQMSSWSS